jgi:MFS superfamily sulfate permease-like transporter
MVWLKKNWRTLVFNIGETILILLIGIALVIPIEYILLVMMTFMISRGLFGKALHFKTWYRCLVWSLLILFSLFVILKIDIVLAIIFSIFSAFIMTGKSDINDLYLWKNNNEPSKYQDIIDFVKYNELDDRLIEFENKVKMRNNLEYLIYKYKFKEERTFSEMSELLDLETPRIVEYLDKIAFAVRLYCGI